MHCGPDGGPVIQSKKQGLCFFEIAEKAETPLLGLAQSCRIYFTEPVAPGIHPQ